MSGRLDCSKQTIKNNNVTDRNNLSHGINRVAKADTEKNSQEENSTDPETVSNTRPHTCQLCGSKINAEQADWLSVTSEVKILDSMWTLDGTPYQDHAWFTLWDGTKFGGNDWTTQITANTVLDITIVMQGPSSTFALFSLAPDFIPVGWRKKVINLGAATNVQTVLHAKIDMTQWNNWPTGVANLLVLHRFGTDPTGTTTWVKVSLNPNTNTVTWINNDNNVPLNITGQVDAIIQEQPIEVKFGELPLWVTLIPPDTDLTDPALYSTNLNAVKQKHSADLKLTINAKTTIHPVANRSVATVLRKILSLIGYCDTFDFNLLRVNVSHKQGDDFISLSSGEVSKTVDINSTLSRELILALLAIGCVEQNPGPPKSRLPARGGIRQSILIDMEVKCADTRAKSVLAIFPLKDDEIVRLNDYVEGCSQFVGDSTTHKGVTLTKFDYFMHIHNDENVVASGSQNSSVLPAHVVIEPEGSKTVDDVLENLADLKAAPASVGVDTDCSEVQRQSLVKHTTKGEDKETKPPKNPSPSSSTPPSIQKNKKPKKMGKQLIVPLDTPKKPKDNIPQNIYYLLRVWNMIDDSALEEDNGEEVEELPTDEKPSDNVKEKQQTRTTRNLPKSTKERVAQNKGKTQFATTPSEQINLAREAYERRKKVETINKRIESKINGSFEQFVVYFTSRLSTKEKRYDRKMVLYQAKKLTHSESISMEAISYLLILLRECTNFVHFTTAVTLASGADRADMASIITQRLIKGRPLSELFIDNVYQTIKVCEFELGPLTTTGGWIKDLTEEGIEPNPGPKDITAMVTKTKEHLEKKKNMVSTIETTPFGNPVAKPASLGTTTNNINIWDANLISQMRKVDWTVDDHAIKADAVIDGYTYLPTQVSIAGVITQITNDSRIFFRRSTGPGPKVKATDWVSSFETASLKMADVVAALRSNTAFYNGQTNYFLWAASQKFSAEGSENSNGSMGLVWANALMDTLSLTGTTQIAPTWNFCDGLYSKPEECLKNVTQDADVFPGLPVLTRNLYVGICGMSDYVRYRIEPEALVDNNATNLTSPPIFVFMTRAQLTNTPTTLTQRTHWLLCHLPRPVINTMVGSAMKQSNNTAVPINFDNEANTNASYFTELYDTIDEGVFVVVVIVDALPVSGALGQGTDNMITTFGGNGAFIQLNSSNAPGNNNVIRNPGVNWERMDWTVVDGFYTDLSLTQRNVHLQLIKEMFLQNYGSKSCLMFGELLAAQGLFRYLPAPVTTWTDSPGQTIFNFGKVQDPLVPNGLNVTSWTQATLNTFYAQQQDCFGNFGVPMDTFNDMYHVPYMDEDLQAALVCGIRVVEDQGDRYGASVNAYGEWQNLFQLSKIIRGICDAEMAKTETTLKQNTGRVLSPSSTADITTNLRSNFVEYIQRSLGYKDYITIETQPLPFDQNIYTQCAYGLTTPRYLIDKSWELTPFYKTTATTSTVDASAILGDDLGFKNVDGTFNVNPIAPVDIAYSKKNVTEEVIKLSQPLVQYTAAWGQQPRPNASVFLYEPLPSKLQPFPLFIVPSSSSSAFGNLRGDLVSYRARVSSDSSTLHFIDSNNLVATGQVDNSELSVAYASTSSPIMTASGNLTYWYSQTPGQKLALGNFFTPAVTSLTKAQKAVIERLNVKAQNPDEGKA